MSWTSSLGNAQLGNLAEAAIADSSVSYQEMLDLLNAATADGVTATEFTDLQTIYTNFSSVYSSDYLKAISYNVIHSNPANAKWWGGAQVIGDVATLGNMAAGMSEQKAGWLVAKWFLGRDLPMPVVGGDTANSKASSGVYNYAVASGPLFVGGAAPADVNQGSAGTCYLVASLGAIAGVNGALITDAFIDNGNGSYGVRFYLAGAPAYVTVDKNVPVNGTNSVALSSNLTHSLAGESWVSLFEKAYAQLNAQANINNATAWTGESSYQSVEGGWANPIKQITNLDYRYYSSYYSGVPDDHKLSEAVSTDPATYKQTIIDALAAGAVGWVGSFGKTTNAGNGKQDFVSGHAFMLLGYDAGTDSFSLRNPWGGVGDGYNPEFTAKIGDFWNSTVKAVVALSEPVAAAPSYTYALATASTAAAPTPEGASITLTITRGGTGTASTVYVSTTPLTAGAADFVALNRVAVNFAAYATTATVAVKTNADDLAEATESLRVDVYATASDTASAANATAYIGDKAADAFTYSIASSAADAGSAVVEGGGITFTITRSATGTASTVYLSTTAGTADGSDIKGLAQSAVTFAAHETVKSVTIPTLQDSVVEGTEDFALELFPNLETKASSASAKGYIKDASLPSYGYTILSSAGSGADAVLEGGKVTFSILRSGTGTASTVYVATVAGSAGNADYTALPAKAVTFEAYQTVATLDVATNEDWWLEAVEYFKLELYLNQGDTTYATYGTGFIADKPNSEFNYTIANSSEATPASEGSDIVFTVTRSGSGIASTVYVSTADGTAGTLDYSPIDKLAVNFAAYETTRTVTVKTLGDQQSEGGEYFFLNLYRNVADSSYATYSKAQIADAAPVDYDYDVTSSAGPGAPVAEGGAITFTITRSGSGAASTVYVNTTSATATADSDFAGLAGQVVNFAAYETTKTVTVETYKDSASEGSEYFWLDLFKSYADSQAGNYASFAGGYITDAAASDYTYAVASNAGFGTPASEGDAIAFTITRSGSGSASTVYVATSDSSARAGADYAGLAIQAVNFAAFETSKTVMVATYQDGVAEGTEHFWLDLYTSYADSQAGKYAGYAGAYIADSAAASFDYTIASNAGASTPVAEGDAVSFTITRSGSGAASTIYLSTSGDTATDGVDFEAWSSRAVTFAADETTRTVTLATYRDNVAEGDESFWLDLYTSYADSQQGSYATYASAHIANVAAEAFDYSVSSDATEGDPVSEGGTVTFTITRSGTGAASTVYVSTSDSTAWADFDFEALYGQKVSFAADETTKTVTVATYHDGYTEGTERFWLDLFTSYADSLVDNYASYASAYISDAAESTFGYSVSTGSTAGTPTAEGDAVSFTITRSGTGAASTVYVSTVDSSAWGGYDYQWLAAQPVSFAAGETTRTVTVATYEDGYTEGTEQFWLALYTSYADSVTDSYAAYSDAYIADPPKSGFQYAVSSNSPAGDPVREGGTITFTVTRNGTGAASTVYVTSVQATAWEDDDYAGLPYVTLDFAAGETTKSVTVQTYNDAYLEGDEYFWLNLYETYADALYNNFATYGTAFIRDFHYPAGAPVGGPSGASPQGSGVGPGAGPGAGPGGLVAEDVAIASYRGDKPGVFANSRAFAAIRADGSVVTWGEAQSGGDSSAVAAQLQGVAQVFANDFAFAALRQDGAVVTWGRADLGGNSAAVAASLDGGVAVVQVFSTMRAFAALRSDGALVTWGDPATGGDSTGVAAKLDGGVDVLAVVSNMSAFAALRADGSVVTWGYGPFGGESSQVAAALDGTTAVVRLAATGSAFAAIRADGSVVTWGNAGDGGDSSAVAAALDGTIDVVGICATSSAFAAIRSDGSVVTWGQDQSGGSSAAVTGLLDGTIDVVALTATDSAFAALRADGSVVAWGSTTGGGVTAPVAAALDGTVDVVKIVATSAAFAALRADGTVVTWGYGPYGGDQSAASGALSGVVRLAATDQAFAALKGDGSVVTWGSYLGGGNSTEVQAQLDGTIDVVQLAGTGLAFAALRADGSVVTWGDQAQGGNSTAVAPALTAVARLAAGGAIDAAEIAIAAADASKAEGAAGATTGFTFTVTRGGNTSSAVSVPYSVAPAALRPAGAGAFVGGALPSGQVSFAAGETSATLTIDVAGDDVAEGNQGFVVTLGPAPVGVAITTASATGTILEDEPIGGIAVMNTTTGLPEAITPIYYTGPVAGLEREFILVSPDDLAIALAGPNWFVHSGSGDDAIAAFGGTNVLDGGTGSNFLTGGPGADTFFIDARGATAPIWSTLNGFSAGDAATLWGISQADFALDWFDDQGAKGYTGLTLHATAAGKPTASLTLPGFTDEQRRAGGLQVAFGHDPASDSDYMYVLAA